MSQTVTRHRGVSGSSAFAKATADIAEASAEACRGAKPLGER